MNWISNVVRPKIRSFLRREVPENLWVKCPETGQLVFYKDLEANQFVIPTSNYHMRMSVTAGVQDFDFLGGSLGMAAGEAVIKGLQTAVERGTPFILFAASGGARMQEGILSLMQLPRTTVAVQELREAKKPYVVVLTNPTTGGVTASYAMLGDVHIAEPGALIGFAGPRVIEQTIREKLPDGFQRAEYLKDHGMVDLVVHRHLLRPTLARLCRVLTKTPAPTDAAALPAPAPA